MAKKISYNTKTSAELETELAKLKAALRMHTVKSFQGKNNGEYTKTRKNIARVLTALHNPLIDRVESSTPKVDK